MSKSKEKHRNHEDADKNHAASAGHASAPAAEAGQPKPADQSPAQKAGVDSAAGGAPAGTEQDRKIEQLQDRLLRLQADFDNFRKRTLRDKNELFDSANQALMLELLPVLDHLQLAIQAASAHKADPAFREGFVLIFEQLMGALAKFGLSPMETEKQVFDANRFEAVNTLPSATEPEGNVLALVRSGYLLRNKLLRPAQVIVSSGPPAPQADAGQEKAKDGADGGKK